MNVAHLDDLDRVEMPEGFVWRPIRRRFDIRAFGTNAYTSTAVGGQIVEEHSEGRLGHEEIYLVLRGRVRFTIEDSEHELRAGQLVCIGDPLLRRGAVALTEDAAVFALGGKPGEAFQPSAWEAVFVAIAVANEGRFDEAIAILEEALSDRPDHASLLYNLACMEARAGRSLDALLHLQRAVELDPSLAGYAAKDGDLASIRAEQGFPAA
jgi:tetratricopeptide (TPR) repeat protein